MFHKLIIAGYLGTDPEMRYMPEGTPVTSLWWIDPKLDEDLGGYLVALCDKCAAEPETARAIQERGWIEIPSTHPRVKAENAYWCSVCGTNWGWW